VLLTSLHHHCWYSATLVAKCLAQHWTVHREHIHWPVECTTPSMCMCWGWKFWTHAV